MNNKNPSSDMSLLLRIPETRLFIKYYIPVAWHTFFWQRMGDENCCHAWVCFHTALLLLVASSELLSIQLQKACKTLSSSKSQTFFFPSPSSLSSPSFIFVGFSSIKLSPDFQTGWKIRVSPVCKRIQRVAFFRCATLQRGGGCAGTGSFRYANGSAG